MPIDPKELRRAVGRRVVTLRAKHRLSQEVLAERTGVSSRYIQYIESGTQNLTLDTLAKLANAFGMPHVTGLFDRHPPETPEPPPASRRPRTTKRPR